MRDGDGLFAFLETVLLSVAFFLLFVFESWLASIWLICAWFCAFYAHHTAINTCTIVCSIVDALRRTSRDSMVSVSTDGKNTMTARHGGLLTLLEAETSNAVLRFWCSSHHIDLKSKDALTKGDDGAFNETADEFSVHLRKQQNLITAMSSQCPRDTTRWLAMGNMLGWMIENRRRLLVLLESRPERAPSSLWWLMASGIQPSLYILSFTLKLLEKHELTAFQKRAEIAVLIFLLSESVRMKPIDCDTSFASLSASNVYSRSCVDSGWWV